MSDRPATAESLHRLVERIVRDVLAERPSSVRSASSASAAALPLDARVVTLDCLQNQSLDAIDEVRLPTGAIVTPAARDLLKTHGVRIVRAAGAKSASPSPPTPLRPVRLFDADGKGRQIALESMLRSRGHQTTAQGSGADFLQPAPAAIDFVIADLPQPIVYQLIHTAGRVAADVGRLEHVQPLVDALQPDAWVIDASAATLALTTAIADRILRRGTH